MTAQTFPVIDLKATGQNIHRLRIERGLSVRDIQQWFHFDQPRAIYKWQNGETLPSVDNLYALSVLLNVSMNDILVTNVKQTSCSGSQLFVCEPAFFNEIGRQRSRRICSFAGIKALTKSTLCQMLKKPARQESKNANKGAYMDVSDRNLHLQLTRQAKNPSDFHSSEGFFAFAGFVSSLRSRRICSFAGIKAYSGLIR